MSRGMKHCGRCKKWRLLDEFGNNRSTKDGYSSYCKPCKRAADARSRAKHPGRYRAHKRESTAARKAAIYSHTPEWADRRAIREFYQNCPEGHEVDHIIPLRGKNVSGLHVLENLQYLTREQNLTKGNTFEG